MAKPTDREMLDKTATELADVLGIDPEFVQVDYRDGRISISQKQATRIVAMLRLRQ